MKIKVCGMGSEENATQIIEHANPDFLGFIFYKKSKRNAFDVEGSFIKNIKTPSVGVFVSEKKETVCNIAEKLDLNYVQLHGKETPEYCEWLKAKGIQIIKAISVKEQNDILLSKQYETIVNYLLFDTKSVLYGGVGKKFDWSFLNSLSVQVPYFLAGGISLEDAGEGKKIKETGAFGLDVNSCFEDNYGKKNVKKVKFFSKKIRQQFYGEI